MRSKQSDLCRADEMHDDREPPNQKKPKKEPPQPAPDPREKQPEPVVHTPRD